ncbi:MAG: family 1 glycosylhydrolase, partial [Deltaproteobacteria bacterium]|nr:family 1 glycosylhydrolase [Deltaproteobacteria bacterium]
YDRVTCDGLSNSAFPTEAPLFTFNPLTLTVTGDASGIDDALTLGKSYNLPIFITETGTLDDADTGAAAKWVAETFTRARRQMDEGVRLEGIYYWTLMDNYEWNHGMSQRYGMYAVDKNDSTKARVPRPKLIDAFKRIAATGLIPDDLVIPPAQ